MSSDSAYNSVAHDPVKTRLLESEAEVEEHSQGPESNIVTGLFFCFCMRLRQCSFHLIISDGVISGIGVLLLTPSVWFSIDHCTLLFDYGSDYDASENRPLLGYSLINTKWIHIITIPNRTLFFIWTHQTLKKVSIATFYFHKKSYLHSSVNMLKWKKNLDIWHWNF